MAMREYLDKRGLRKLTSIINKLFKRTWHGTRTEWDALSDEEKAQWEQAEIEEEDGNNGNGVVYVADRVEKGNYNPVTSNAVAEACFNFTPENNVEYFTGRYTLDGKKIYTKMFKTNINLTSETRFPDLSNFNWVLYNSGDITPYIADFDELIAIHGTMAVDLIDTNGSYTRYISSGNVVPSSVPQHTTENVAQHTFGYSLVKRNDVFSMQIRIAAVRTNYNVITVVEYTKKEA